MSIRPERSHRARIAGEVALSVGAVAGLLCILATVAALLFGTTPLLFRSGSMEPTIPTGALAFAQSTPAVELNAGDVISVVNQQDVRVTHRIASVDAVAGDAAALTLQGDANPEPDTQSYVITSAERVVFHVDGLGYALSWLRTPSAMILGGLVVAVLLWLIVWPSGRRRSNVGSSSGRTSSRSPAQTDRIALAPLFILGLATTMVLGLGNVPGTAAAFTDTATANTGSFASRAVFTPTVADSVTCANNNDTGRNGDPVTLTWKHVGAPYQYRIIVRATATYGGAVWRTVDITNVTAATGADVVYNLDAIGTPYYPAVVYRYVAEIHTMLPGGAVSPAWSGYPLTKPGTANQYQDFNCALIGEKSGSPSYVPPAASVTCATITPNPTYARIEWPHQGSPYTYYVTVRNTATGNALFTANVAAPAGSTARYDLLVSALATGDRASGPATVEVRTVDGASLSTGFVATGINIVSAATGIACAAPAAGAARMAAPPTTITTTPSTTTSTTEPSTTTPAPSTTTTTTTTTTEPVAPKPEPAPAPAPEPAPEPEPSLSSEVRSSSGSYSAQLVQGESGPAAVIRDTSGNEVYRTAAGANATVEWVSGSDELLITDGSGSWSVTRSSGSWVKAPVVEEPAAVQAPPATEEKPQPVDTPAATPEQEPAEPEQPGG